MLVTYFSLIIKLLAVCNWLLAAVHKKIDYPFNLVRNEELLIQYKLNVLPRQNQLPRFYCG